MRLSVQLAVVIAGSSIAGILVTGGFAMQTATRTAEEKSQEILQREATGLATYVETWTQTQVDSLGGWTVPFVLGENRELQRRLLDAVLMAMPSSISGVGFVDPERVAAAVWVTQETPRDAQAGAAERAQRMVGRLPLTDALDARRVAEGRGELLPVGIAIGEPFLSEGGSASVPIAVAGPTDRVGRLVLGAEVSLDEVERLLRGQVTPERGVVVLSESGEAMIGGKHPLVDPSYLKSLRGAGQATFHYALADGQIAHGALAVVPSTRWVVVVVEPEAVAARGAAEIQLWTLQILGVSVLLAMGIAFVVARSLSRPVTELRDSALAVAEGALGRQVEVDRADEVGELGRAFNHMSARLKRDQDEIRRQQSEIEAFNLVLQQRVEDRTRELQDAQGREVRSGQLAAVAELGAGMAHELNNPLAAILGLAQVLRTKAKGTPDEALLGRIEEQTARCRDVVAAMLRLSSGEMDLRRAPVVDVRVALRDGIGIAAGPFRQRGVSLTFVEGDTLLPVRVDPLAASRIIAQILNSLGAGLGEGAAVRISAQRDADEVVVELLADRPVAARDDYMAQGMGLWVARHVLDRLGGRLEVPEGGLAWRVILPVAGAS